MPTPLWSKVTDEAKTLAGDAQVEAEKLKHWALTGEDKVVDTGRSWPMKAALAASVIVLAVGLIAWLF
jgi:hypothetical protein